VRQAGQEFKPPGLLAFFGVQTGVQKLSNDVTFRHFAALDTSLSR